MIQHPQQHRVERGQGIAPTLPRVLIVADHASAILGGEAALPLHYYRMLRRRGADVWLVTHSRTRDELAQIFPDDPRIHYIEDTFSHRLLWGIGRRKPEMVDYITTGFLSRVITQLLQRRVIRDIVKREAIDIVHQPTPVSPREPSLIFGVGAPVIIGPMNGGMRFPPGFQSSRGPLERLMYRAGRHSASLLNWLLPGKRQASLLLVANLRTREALPRGVCSWVEELAENGVDLALWRIEMAPPAEPAQSVGAHFVFMGRLVDLKAVDLLLLAFKDAAARAPMRLTIVGDGGERPSLERLAADIGVLAGANHEHGTVRFVGWLPQNECAQLLGRADGLVMPSVRECGGAVVLEAMSMAKPVIATAWGGPLDYLDNSCGVLVEPRGKEALVSGFADAMERLTTSPAERLRLGRSGREKVLQKYDWEAKLDVMLRLYNKVISEQAGRKKNGAMDTAPSEQRLGQP